MSKRQFLPIRFPINDLGATLVELLVMCAVLGIISVAVIIIINPIDAIKKSHDARRISDLALISQAIEQYVADNQNLPPDANTTLRQSNIGTPSANLTKSNGTGWIPVDLSKYTERLPVDPINSAPFVYRYYRNGYSYKVDAKLEYYTDKMASDSGNDTCRYESGSDPKIVLPSLC